MAHTRDGNLSSTYLALLKKYPLRSLRTKSDLRKARTIMDELLRRGPIDQGEDDYLDALSDLVEVYEDDHFPIDEPTDAAMLAHLLETSGITQSELAAKIHTARSTICQVLSGERDLTRRQLTDLCNYFGISPNVFLRCERAER